jgi:hypothetical protein
MSYAEMMSFSGIGRRAAISGALAGLKQKHLLEPVTAQRREGAIKPVGTYRVSDEHPDLQEMLADMRRQRQQQAEYTRAAARAAREERKRVTEAKRRTAARTLVPFPSKHTPKVKEGGVAYLKVLHSSTVGTHVRFPSSHVGTGKSDTRTETKDLQTAPLQVSEALWKWAWN